MSQHRDIYYWSSDDPRVLAVWEANLASLNLISKRIATLRARLPGEPKMMVSHTTSHCRLAGVDAERGQLDGSWRLGPHGMYVPYRNHLRDDDLVTEWVGCRCEFAPMPGMVNRVFSGETSVFANPGWEMLDRTVWVWFKVTDPELVAVDPAIWARRRPSEFHLSKEQESDDG